MPRFSVIVPIYNVENYLAECLDSLLRQSYRDFEAILIDDVSSDNSLQIAQDYAKKHPDLFKVIRHSVNKGLGGARNTGIETATGEYLLFLDSDDYLRKDALELLDNKITCTSADIVEFRFDFVDESCRYLRSSSCPERQMPLTRSVNACNKAFCAKLFTDIRFPEKRYYEDYFTIPKLLMTAPKTVSLDESLYGYRQRIGSIIHDTNIEKNRDIMAGTQVLLDYWKEKDFGPELFYGLEYLAIYHVLYHAILRVNSIDRHSDLQQILKDFVDTHFPDHIHNPYRNYLSAKEKKLLHLIQAKRWNTLYLRYHCRNRITGSIKRCLWKLKGK